MMDHKSGTRHIYSLNYIWVPACLLALKFVFYIPTNAVAQSNTFDRPSTTTMTLQQNGHALWWAQPLATISGVIIGALMIVWQLNRQHRNASALQLEQHNLTLNQQDRHFKIKLRLDVYNDITGALSSAIASVSDVTATALLTSQRLSHACLISTSDEVMILPIGDGYLDITDKINAMNSDITKLSGVIEKYEIINSNMSIFRTAFASSSYDIIDLASSNHDLMTNVLHSRKWQMGDLARPPFVASRSTVKPLIHGFNAMYSKFMDISGFLLDCGREMQKVFLGELFDGDIPKRVPLDPNTVVITTDHDSVVRLNRYFETQTEWGRNQARIEKDTRDRFGSV